MASNRVRATSKRPRAASSGMARTRAGGASKAVRAGAASATSAGSADNIAAARTMRVKLGRDILDVRLSVAMAPKVVGPPQPPRHWVLDIRLGEVPAGVPTTMAGPLVTGPPNPPR